MPSPECFDIDPRSLRLLPSRSEGADLGKLQRQISRHGRSTDGMPNILVHRASDGERVIYDGVTRATRVAKLLPGHTVPVEVIGDLACVGAKSQTVAEKLP